MGATTMPGVPRLARALSKVPSEHNTEHAVSACLHVCYSFLVPTPLVSSLRKDQYSRLNYRCTAQLRRDPHSSYMGRLVLASALATLMISYLYRTCFCITLSGIGACCKLLGEL